VFLILTDVIIADRSCHYGSAISGSISQVRRFAHQKTTISGLRFPLHCTSSTFCCSLRARASTLTVLIGLCARPRGWPPMELAICIQSLSKLPEAILLPESRRERVRGLRHLPLPPLFMEPRSSNAHIHQARTVRTKSEQAEFLLSLSIPFLAVFFVYAVLCVVLP